MGWLASGSSRARPRTCEKKWSGDSWPPASNAFARAPSPLASGRDGTIAAVDGPDRVSMTADIAWFVPDGDAPPFSLSVNPHPLLYAERRARRQAAIHVQPAAAAGRRPAALRLGPAPPRHAGRDRKSTSLN